MNNDPITLDHPFELAPHPRLTTVSLRRPKVKDELEAKRRGNSDAEVEVHLFALLSGQAYDVIAELDLADYDKLQDRLADFRERSGATSSGAAPGTSESAASASEGSA